jgi:hypothetical protein
LYLAYLLSYYLQIDRTMCIYKGSENYVSQTATKTLRWRPPTSKGNFTSMKNNTANVSCLVMHTQSHTQMCCIAEGAEHRGNPTITNWPMHNILHMRVCLCVCMCVCVHAFGLVDVTPTKHVCISAGLELYNIYRHFMQKFNVFNKPPIFLCKVYLCSATTRRWSRWTCCSYDTLCVKI